MKHALAERLFSTNWDSWNRPRLAKVTIILLIPTAILVGWLVGLYAEHYVLIRSIPTPVYWFCLTIAVYISIAFADYAIQ